MDQRSTRVGREKIVAVAEELFTERGYRAVSIRDIADACQVTSAALYYHFPSKEALFRMVMENHAKKLSDHMKQAGNVNGSTRDKITAILVEYARITADRRSPIFLLRREDPATNGDQHWKDASKLFHALLQPLDEVLMSAIDGGELRMLEGKLSPASLLVGMLHGMIQHQRMCLHKSFTNEDIMQVVDIFWSGMKV